MKEEDHSHPASLEDRAAERALSALEQGATDGESVALEREFFELFGLLPEALQPVSPRPDVKAALMRRLGAEADPDSRAGATVVPFVGSGPDSTAPAPAARRWELSTLLAAALAAVSIGLAAWGGWLSARLDDERLRLAVMEERLVDQQEDAQEIRAVRRELDELRQQLALVTSPGVEVCTLRPGTGAAVHPDARGLLYISPDHERWILAADKLEPCPMGRLYHVWFVTPEGVVKGASFNVKKGERLEISREGMPDGTRAVMITLQHGEDPEAPEGPTVLYGDEPVLML